MTFEWNLNWFIATAIALALFLMKLIPWLLNRSKPKQVDKPDIGVSQTLQQRQDSEVATHDDGRILALASFTVSNGSLIPVQVKSFTLAGEPIISDSSDMLDQVGPAFVTEGRIVRTRAVPCSPVLPRKIVDKGKESFLVYFETPDLVAPDAGDMTVRLVVRYDKNFLASFTILVHGSRHCSEVDESVGPQSNP